MVTLQRTMSNVTPRQIEVMNFLARKEQWLVGEIAAGLGITSAATTKAIIRLERKGLVSRTIDVMDRRCVNVRLTQLGTETIHQSEVEQASSSQA